MAKKGSPPGRPKPRVTFTYQGETLSQSAWARRLGVSTACLVSRRKKTADVEAILGTPIRAERGFAAAVAAYLDGQEDRG